MKIFSLALFAGSSTAAISAWTNTTSKGRGGGVPGQHQFTNFTAPRTESANATSSAITVTGITTFCPETTLLTITTCKNNKCSPTVVTVTEPSTVIITEECLIGSTSGARSVALHSFPPPVTKTEEDTVTSLTTYCPGPTVFTYTKYVHHKRVPVIVTVTKATTITISETCIRVRTFTEKATITPTVVLHEVDQQVVHGTVTRAVTRTVTDLVTYCPSATVLTVTRYSHHVHTLSVVTVTQATTITLSGTCIIPMTVTEEITLTAFRPKPSAFATAVTESTVTDLTTHVSGNTVIVVKTCTTGKCARSSITVTEATTLTIPGTLVVPSHVTARVAPMGAAPEKVSPSVFIVEYTVTELETFVPEATTLTVTKCVNGVCAPLCVTVTAATTLTFSRKLVVTSTITEGTALVGTVSESGTFGVTVVESTVTEISTVISEATSLTVTPCVGNTCTPSVTAVTESTTLVIPGTFVVANSVAAIVNAQTFTQATAIATTSSASVQAVAVAAQNSEFVTLTSAITQSPVPAVTSFPNSAARNFFSLVGVLGFIALLF